METNILIATVSTLMELVRKGGQVNAGFRKTDSEVQGAEMDDAGRAGRKARCTKLEEMIQNLPEENQMLFIQRNRQ